MRCRYAAKWGVNSVFEDAGRKAAQECEEALDRWTALVKGTPSTLKVARYFKRSTSNEAMQAELAQIDAKRPAAPAGVGYSYRN